METKLKKGQPEPQGFKRGEHNTMKRVAKIEEIDQRLAASTTNPSGEPHSILASRGLKPSDPSKKR